MKYIHNAGNSIGDILQGKMENGSSILRVVHTARQPETSTRVLTRLRQAVGVEPPVVLPGDQLITRLKQAESDGDRARVSAIFTEARNHKDSHDRQAPLAHVMKECTDSLQRIIAGNPRKIVVNTANPVKALQPADRTPNEGLLKREADKKASLIKEYCRWSGSSPIAALQNMSMDQLRDSIRKARKAKYAHFSGGKAKPDEKKKKDGAKKLKKSQLIQMEVAAKAAVIVS